jgi:hypothetical protein
MGTIISDAAIYTYALSSSLRYQHMMGFPGYQTPGSFPLGLQFHPQSAPMTSPSTSAYGASSSNLPPSQLPMMPYHAGFFPNQVPSSVVTITSAITIKLTSDNYMFWSAQVGPLLRSHLLMGYVDGSLICPNPHIVASHAGSLHQQPNPAHQHWIQQD